MLHSSEWPPLFHKERESSANPRAAERYRSSERMEIGPLVVDSRTVASGPPNSIRFGWSHVRRASRHWTARHSIGPRPELSTRTDAR
jgi:hypothetical protein